MAQGNSTQQQQEGGIPLLAKDDQHSKHPGRRTLVWDELPAWMQDNQYIRSGYRPPSNSFARCFASILYLHNETGNIFSHLLGALMFLVLCFTVTQRIFPEFATVDWQDIATVYIFLLGAVGCMGLSALFHTVSCHSQGVQKAYNKCDYVGIVFLIVGSCVPIFCYAFYCHPRLKLFYLSLIFALGALTVVLVVAPKFATSEYRPLRAATFVALGLAGAIPAIHTTLAFGWSYTINAVQIHYMLLMGGFYIAGAAIYGARIPERWWPGKFDYWLHSHQIFHVFVVIAAVFHYIGVIKALRWTHTVGLGMCNAQ
ncbi:HlyIII-domain-containing protein [Martensiomyces pterosporus]|nr:HlyIII-domain-containing protein [Martensiomyces pterosporus]